MLYISAIVLNADTPSSVEVLLGCPGHEWRWEVNGSSSVPGGALVTQHTEQPDAPFDESWESLYLLRKLPQHCCCVPASRLLQLPMPVFCGAGREGMQALWPVGLSQPHLKLAALAFAETTGQSADESALKGVNMDASGTAGFAGVEGVLQQQVAPAAAAAGASAVAAAAGVAATVVKPDLQTSAAGVSDSAVQTADAAKADLGDVADRVQQGAGDLAQKVQEEGSALASGTAAGGVPSGTPSHPSAYPAGHSSVPDLHLSAPPGAGELTGDVETGAKQAASTAAFWGSEAATGIARVQFPAVVPALYKLPRVGAAAALAAATGTASSIAAVAKHWLKIEVFIDFAQVLGLFISNLSSEAMRAAEGVFGRAAGFLALDWNVTFPQLNDYPLYLYGGLGALALLILVVYLWAMALTRSLQADELRQGREAKGWDAMRAAHPRRLWVMEKVLTASFLAYLPVSRAAMEVLVCAPSIGRAMQALGAGVSCTKHAIDDTYACDCSQWTYYTEFSILMGLILLLFTLGLPLRTYQLIQANKPVGSREQPDMRFDDQGVLVLYTDEMYERDLTTDPKQVASPYRGLYMPYTRKAAHWKVVTLMMKLLLTVAVVVIHSNLLTQACISIAVLLVMVLLGYRVSPFLNDAADRMDLSGRVTNLLTVALGLIGSERILDSKKLIHLAGLGINVVNAVNAAFMLLLLLWGIPLVRRLTQAAFGFLLFESASSNRIGRFKRTLLDRHGHLQVDLRRELKLRVWQPFWDGVMAHGCSKDVAQRFVQLQRIAADAGRERIIEHFWYAARHANDRAFIMNHLEGVDAYWDGADGAQSSSCFGKATVSLYPFHVTFAYDEDDRVAFIWEKDAHRFVVLNKTKDVQRRRHNRECLRSASYGRQLLHLHHTERRSYTFPDGTETYRDSNGNTQTRTVYSTITVTLTFQRCRVDLEDADANTMARGFSLQVRFADGHGSGVLPRTGQRKELRNQVTSLSADYLGFSIKYEANGRLAKELLTRGENRAIYKSTLSDWHTFCEAYRAGAWRNALAAEQTLSSAFWLYVYDQPQLNFQGLTRYLEVWERNADLSPVVFLGKHQPGVEFITARMSVLSAHPCNALWYCFWESVWHCNRGLGVVESNAPLLDVNRSSAIAYKPLKQEALLEKLQDSGLLGSCGRFVGGSTLQGLYGALQEVNERYQSDPEGAWAPVSSVAAKGAPSPRHRALSPQRRAGTAVPHELSSELAPIMGGGADMHDSAAGGASAPLLSG